MVSKVFMSRAIESGFRRKGGEGKKGKSGQGKEGKIRRWKVKLISSLFNLLKKGADKTTWSKGHNLSLFWVDPGQPIWSVTRSLYWVDHRVGFKNYGLLPLWSQVRALWLLIWWPLEVYMVVNFRARGISRGTRKLARTPTLN